MNWISPYRRFALWIGVAIFLAAGPVQAFCANVLFVRNNGPGGTGGKDDPLLVLPFFTDPSVDVVYLYIGTGTSLNQQNGIFLGENQKLIGETIGYEDDCNDIPATISAARPTLSNSAGAAIILSTGSEVAGIRIQESLAGGILGTLSQDIYIHDNRFEAAGVGLIQVVGEHRIEDNEFTGSAGPAIAVLHMGGAFALTISGNTIDEAVGQGLAVSSLTTTQFIEVDILNNTISNFDDEAIELDEIYGAVTIEGNHISNGGDGMDIDKVEGNLTIATNEVDDVEGDRILIEIEGDQVLDLTIHDNDLNHSSSELAVNFGSGIWITARDSSTLRALIDNNTTLRAGNTGIMLDAREDSTVAGRIAFNRVEDPRFNGIRVGSSSNAWLRTAIERNTVERAGADGIGSTLTSNTLDQDLVIENNLIEDAFDDGISLNVDGVGIHQLDSRIQSNRIYRSGDRAVRVDASVGVGSAEFTLWFAYNTLVGSADEGFRIDVSGETDAAVHARENTFVNNQQILDHGYNAAAVGEGGLCTALEQNESDNDYRLAAVGDGLHIYESSYLSNIGDVLLESVSGGTIFEVANGSCREVDIGPLPVPQAQPVPEALADQLGVAALVVLLACRRWRARPSARCDQIDADSLGLARAR